MDKTEIKPLAPLPCHDIITIDTLFPRVRHCYLQHSVLYFVEFHKKLNSNFQAYCAGMEESRHFLVASSYSYTNQPSRLVSDTHLGVS